MGRRKYHRVAADRDGRVIAAWSHRAERGSQRRPSHPETAAEQEHTMRTSRLVRSFVVAGTAAMLTLLSLASAALAGTGGGGFPS